MPVGNQGKATKGQRQHGEGGTAIAQANRIAALTHEASQPIAAVVLNAEAALRWLGTEPPNLDEVRAALDRIIEDGNRAGDLVNDIRSALRKAPI